MTIQRPTADDLMQTRLRTAAKISELRDEFDPDGFAWSHSYRQDVTALLARLAAAEQERDEAYARGVMDGRMARFQAAGETTADAILRAEAAAARAEAAEQALRRIADGTWNVGSVVSRPVREFARAALAGREETGGG